MDLSTPQLAALVAIADLGTFEAAARHLHVTPSAVSQRIRALESAAGQVLVRRGTPCTPTAAGERLLAVARQTQLLLAEVQTTPSVVDLPLAVNADSLATWWRPVIGEVATWEDVTLRLHVEDQAFSSDLLRRGDVLAAVTSEPQAVQGCAVERLGTMRYLPAATPAFAQRWHTGRGYDWAAMPTVVFNDKDDLQHEVLRRRGLERARIVHRVPTSADAPDSARMRRSRSVRRAISAAPAPLATSTSAPPARARPCCHPGLDPMAAARNCQVAAGSETSSGDIGAPERVRIPVRYPHRSLGSQSDASGKRSSTKASRDCTRDPAAAVDDPGSGTVPGAAIRAEGKPTRSVATGTATRPTTDTAPTPTSSMRSPTPTVRCTSRATGPQVSAAGSVPGRCDCSTRGTVNATSPARIGSRPARTADMPRASGSERSI